MANYTRKPVRKTLRQTIDDNRAHLIGLAKLAGKPPPVFEPLPEIKKRSPSQPGNHPSEAQVLKSVMAYLRVHPNVAWRCRINSGTFCEDDRFVQSNSQRGMSDIIGMLKGGRLFAIEVKSKMGKLSDNQRDFLHLIAYENGLSGVARCIEDVDRILSGEI